MDTINLLNSLADQTDKDFQIIVVDNASVEEDFSALGGSAPGGNNILLIRNEKNLGFSGGNNIGIKKALENGSNWVVLINNDTVVESSFIGALKAKLGGLEGIVGIPLAEDGYTAYYGLIEWLKPTLRHGYNPLYSEYLRRNRSYYSIGAAMAIHENVFDEIGLLDEKYFLYFEDADFSLRAGRASVPINFIDEPKVQHKEVSKTNRKLGNPLLLRYHYRNALYFNQKNGPWYIKILVWPWSFWIIKKQIFKIIFFYRRDESLAILSGVFDFYKNKMGKIV
ncbi:MAG: glycosyltransferase family 2 protein [Candidatus Yanofskybacteria bacterium]|nr:glycosyltransferase family 2 protein [Candidatus Yanofskybacteria bacterium]